MPPARSPLSFPPNARCNLHLRLLPPRRSLPHSPLTTPPLSNLIQPSTSRLATRYHHHHHYHHQRPLTPTPHSHQQNQNAYSTGPSSPLKYTYPTLSALISKISPKPKPNPPNENENKKKYTLIDVREPSELASTGRIPTAHSMPLTSNPDAFHLSAEDFFDRFGFEKPSASTHTATPQDGDDKDGEDDVVIFYCKAGVRSRAAARLAGREWAAEGEGDRDEGEVRLRIGDYSGGWVDWERNGGVRERD